MKNQIIIKNLFAVITAVLFIVMFYADGFSQTKQKVKNIVIVHGAFRCVGLGGHL